MLKNFTIKLVSFLLVLSCIAYYQYNAQLWSAAEENNRIQITEIEAYNQKVLARANEEKVTHLFKDGQYEDSAMGFGGQIVVEVIIKDGIIETVNIKEAKKEDSTYLSMAKSIIDDIIKNQSSDVDTVSGATYSSTGIKEAVRKALIKAKQE